MRKLTRPPLMATNMHDEGAVTADAPSEWIATAEKKKIVLTTRTASVVGLRILRPRITTKNNNNPRMVNFSAVYDYSFVLIFFFH